MTLINNRAPLLSNIKLYASFHHHTSIQTGVTVRKRLSWVVTSVTLTFDLWPWPFAWTWLWSLVITPENFMMIRWWEHSQKGVTDRQTDRRTDGQTDGRTDGQTENTICRAAWSQLKTIGHLFFATSSFVHHFIAIGDLKLELQSGNAQFGSNSTIFRAVWPCNSHLSHSPETPNLGQIRRFLELCDLAIWRMTLKNNRAPLLFYLKLCASFRNHWCIETWVTVRKRPIWVKFDDF